MSEKFYIHSTSIADQSAQIGEGTQISEYSCIQGNSYIGKNCQIGRNVTISEGVILGDNIAIGNNSSLESGVILENYIHIGHSTVLSTRNYFNRYNKSFVQLLKPIIVKEGASIGHNSTVFAGVTIGEFALIGAGSVITQSIESHKAVYGNPMMDLGWVCKCGHNFILNLEDESSLAKIVCDRCHSIYHYCDGKLTALTQATQLIETGNPLFNHS